MVTISGQPWQSRPSCRVGGVDAGAGAGTAAIRGSGCDSGDVIGPARTGGGGTSTVPGRAEEDTGGAGVAVEARGGAAANCVAANGGRSRMTQYVSPPPIPIKATA